MSAVEFERCDPSDFSKLDIRDGMIHYKLYQQDGTFQAMTAEDNMSNRRYVSWIQIHDRYNLTDTQGEE